MSCCSYLIKNKRYCYEISGWWQFNTFLVLDFLFVYFSLSPSIPSPSTQLNLGIVVIYCSSLRLMDKCFINCLLCPWQLQINGVSVNFVRIICNIKFKLVSRNWNVLHDAEWILFVSKVSGDRCKSIRHLFILNTK